MEVEGNRDMDFNTEYEVFVKDVYEAILMNEGQRNIEVQHNVKLRGKSGCNHQIDILIQYSIAGDTFRIAVECKNYSKSISISRVRDFFAVCHDIGRINGVIATKIGYQKGAELFGSYYGIQLKVVRPPQDQDWSGRLRKVQFDTVILGIKVKGWEVIFDREWIDKNCEDIELSSIEPHFGMNYETFIVDINNDKIVDFGKLEEKIPRTAEGRSNVKHSFLFNEKNSFLNTNVGLLKIHSINVFFDEKPLKRVSEIDSYFLTKAIFKDIDSGDIKFIKFNS